MNNRRALAAAGNHKPLQLRREVMRGWHPGTLQCAGLLKEERIVRRHKDISERRSDRKLRKGGFGPRRLGDLFAPLEHSILWTAL